MKMRPRRPISFPSLPQFVEISLRDQSLDVSLPNVELAVLGQVNGPAKSFVSHASGRSGRSSANQGPALTHIPSGSLQRL